MKKLIIFLLCFAVVVSFNGCGSENTNNKDFQITLKNSIQTENGYN